MSLAQCATSVEVRVISRVSARADVEALVVEATAVAGAAEEAAVEVSFTLSRSVVGLRDLCTASLLQLRRAGSLCT